MKTILVPIDFSETSHNAAKYATELSKASGATIVLFHAYHVPVVASETATFVPSLEDVERGCLDSLQGLKEELMFQNEKTVSVNCICKCGFAVDEISLYAEEHHVDLIVMGTQGAGYIAERLLGSTTTALINKTKAPILAVDKHFTFRGIKKIALACEYMDDRNSNVLKPLKQFAHLFGAHVYVVNVDVAELKSTPASEVPGDFLNLGDSLTDLDHSYHYIPAEDIVAGVNEFVSGHHADMVAIIPEKHSLWDKILHEPLTKQLAFHSKVPVLILH